MEVDINRIKPNNYNPKTTEDHKDKYELIVEGIKQMGMKSPIDVRELDGGMWEIIDGFHRWTACKELGWKIIPIASWGKINDIQARKITILKEKAKIPLDLIKTSQILNELITDTSLEELAKQIGYKLPELEEDLKLAKFDWGEYDKNKGQDSDSGEGLRTLSIIMQDNQYKIVIKAIEVAKGKTGTESDARGIELICADYLAGK